MPFPSPRGLPNPGIDPRSLALQADSLLSETPEKPNGHDGGGRLVAVAKSCLTLVSPWTVANQVPLSIGFSRQEYWSELPFPSPGDLPNRGMEPGSPTLQAASLPTELPVKLPFPQIQVYLLSPAGHPSSI